MNMYFVTYPISSVLASKQCNLNEEIIYYYLLLSMRFLQIIVSHQILQQYLFYWSLYKTRIFRKTKSLKIN